MKNYLSFGGGVNSVAMMLLLLDEGVEFEAVYVDHGCDWPETLEYVAMLQTSYKITVLTPQVEGFTNLYEYLWSKGKIPMRFPRWCTVDWKSLPLSKYYEKPAWVNIGYASDESHRAVITSEKGFEYRFPLIEREITRAGCIEIIKSHGLPVPMKSGCWFCPFQGIKGYKQLRRKHPDLFCKVVALEERHIDEAWNRYMRCDGTRIIHKPMRDVIDDSNQDWLFEEMSYPPCQCGL
jgi:hypothetical protein